MTTCTFCKDGDCGLNYGDKKKCDCPYGCHNENYKKCPTCNGSGKIAKCICRVEYKNGAYILVRNPNCNAHW